MEKNSNNNNSSNSLAADKNLLCRSRRCSVHFGDVGDEKAETDAHTNDIVIQRLNDDQRTLDLHLGFLQVWKLFFKSLSNLVQPDSCWAFASCRFSLCSASPNRLGRLFIDISG